MPQHKSNKHRREPAPPQFRLPKRRRSAAAVLRRKPVAAGIAVLLAAGAVTGIVVGTSGGSGNSGGTQHDAGAVTVPLPRVPSSSASKAAASPPATVTYSGGAPRPKYTAADPDPGSSAVTPGVSVSGGELSVDVGKLAPSGTVLALFTPTTERNSWRTVSSLGADDGLSALRYAPSARALVVGYTASPRSVAAQPWPYSDATYVVTSSHADAVAEQSAIDAAKSPAQSFADTVVGSTVVITPASSDPARVLSGPRLSSDRGYSQSVSGKQLTGSGSTLWSDVPAYARAASSGAAPAASALLSRYTGSLAGAHSYVLASSAGDAASWSGTWSGLPGAAFSPSAVIDRLRAVAEGPQPTCSTDNCGAPALSTLTPQQEAAATVLSGFPVRSSGGSAEFVLSPLRLASGLGGRSGVTGSETSFSFAVQRSGAATVSLSVPR